MNNCDHDFFKIKSFIDSDRVGVTTTDSTYAIAVCVYCGQVRHIYANGAVHVVKTNGQISWPPQA